MVRHSSEVDRVPRGGCLAFLLVAGLSGCAPPSWSVESESLEGSLTLLDEVRSQTFEFTAETSHEGRVHARVNLPGASVGAPTQTPDVDVPLEEPSEPEAPQRLVVAELSLAKEHSLVTLPGSGGMLSVLCPSPRCRESSAVLSLRAVDGADLGTQGVIIEWSAYAETFGPGEVEPETASADIALSE